MKGKHLITVKSRRLQYKFTIERNITILRGDSATGKTTLIDMIASYQNNGENSGIMISSDKPCAVLSGIHWKENLSLIKDSIVFIDEGDRFVSSKEFAEAAKASDNYYVIATRSSLFNLPYSVKEIYGIKNKSGNRYQGTKRLYSEFYPLVETSLPVIQKPDLVIVEDSNSGYQFFAKVFDEFGIPCVSAKGKSNIYRELVSREYSTALVIADGAAFGPEIERVYALKAAKHIILFLPESFEWLILKSDLLKNAEVNKILTTPNDSIESHDYFSWEQFFTHLLIKNTQGTYLQYNKQQLNPNFMQPHEQESILEEVPLFDF